jgi:hypothetical protein
MGYRAFGACALVLLSGCWAVDGNGNRVTERRRVPEVSRISNESEFDIDISQGDTFEVRVRIDSNLQKHVDTEVRGDTLVIDSDAWVVDSESGPHVLITMPRLESLSNNGSGSVFAAWFDEPEDVHMRLSGSGDLGFEGTAPRIVAELDGSGDMHLNGSTDFAELTIDGSGDIEANGLVAAGADVVADGSGDLRVTVDGKVDARADGSGDVELSGGVQRGHFSEGGSGNIRVH